MLKSEIGKVGSRIFDKSIFYVIRKGFQSLRKMVQTLKLLENDSKSIDITKREQWNFMFIPFS